jgi:cytochrome b
MSAGVQAVRVWDLPTRLFHWGLAACVVGSVVTAKVGGNAMVWHFRLGYVVFALLAFRILWGLVGGHWSRFTSFVRMPGTVLSYLRGQADPALRLDVGHNPLGALSVLGLIGILALQVGTGLFADDEIANAGPLTSLASGALVSTLTTWHKSYGQWIVLSLVALHIAAILFYLLKKGHNLVRPMLTGDKLLPADTPASSDGWGQRLSAAVVVGLCALLVAWVVQLGAGTGGGG